MDPDTSDQLETCHRDLLPTKVVKWQDLRAGNMREWLAWGYLNAEPDEKPEYSEICDAMLEVVEVWLAGGGFPGIEDEQSVKVVQKQSSQKSQHGAPFRWGGTKWQLPDNNS